jgi:hypothetical protein
MTKILCRRIATVLEPLGFLTTGDTWRRNHAIAFDVAHLHLAPYSSGVTVIVGVYFKSLGIDTNPIVDKCHVSNRILADPDEHGGDRIAQAFDDSEEHIRKIERALVTVGMPWLDAIKTEAGMLAEQAKGVTTIPPALQEAMRYGVIHLP